MTKALALFAATFLAAAPLSLFAQPAPRCAIAAFPAPGLCARAGLDTVPASYLLVVDESGSMSPLWGDVRSALAGFAEAVPEGSELDVRFFAERVRQGIPATVSTPAVRGSWAATLSALPTPRGTRTDLGSAAQNALGKLASAPADRLQFVFFLTDGRQEPGPSSPFPERWGGDWPRLAGQAGQVLGARPVRVGIVRLSPEADASLLGRVFPDAIVTDAIGAGALRSWFANQAREGAVGKLLLLLEDDLRRPAATLVSERPLRTYAGRAVRHEVLLRPERRVLTTLLPAGTVVPLPGGGSATLESEARLDPRGGPVRVRAAVRDRAYLPILPPGIVPRQAEGPAPVRSRLEPADELARIGVVVDAARMDTVVASLALRGGGAVPWPLFVLAAALLAATAVWLLLRAKWGMHRAFLPGRVLNLRHRQADGALVDGESAVVDFRGQKQREYTVRHPDGRASVVLEAASRRGRTVVLVRPADPAVRIRADGRPLAAPLEVKRLTRFESDLGEFRYDPH